MEFQQLTVISLSPWGLGEILSHLPKLATLSFVYFQSCSECSLGYLKSFTVASYILN